MSGLPGGGGAQLGQAVGSITINTSQLVAAQQAVQAAARAMNQAFASINQGTMTAQSGFTSLSKGISSLRGELVAVGAAGGLITKFGLDATLSVRNYTVAFKQFTGNQAASVKLMDELTKKASEFGLEVEGVWQLGRSLLPILKGNTAELDKWVVRAAELRSVFPMAQKGAETRAISEFMAGQNMSLQRLFNIPPSVIAEAKAKFSDLGQQVDYILAKMGVTEAGAKEMANGFVSVGNELKLIAATAFGPLLKDLTPILHGFAEWLSTLRDANPAILTFGAGIATIATVGAPSLLLLNQLIIAADKLKLLGVLGSVGKLGLQGAAVIGGFAAGVGIDQQIGKATGWQSFQNITAKGELEKFATALHLAAAHLLDFSAAVLNAAAGMSEMLGRIMNAIGQQQVAEQAQINAQSMRSQANAYTAGATERRSIGGRGLFGDRDDVSRQNRFVGGPLVPPTDAVVEWARSVQKIETDANNARVEATTQYESQRSETIRNYEQSIAREEEDFNISRARQAADLAASIARIGADSARQAAKWAVDLADSIAKATADSNKRISEINEQYNKQRIKAERDHHDNLLEAAANLDAKAVFNEQKNFARSSKDAADAHDEQLSKEAKNLADRIKQDQDANTKRLADAKEADDIRIQDAKDALTKQQMQEDEDRALRLQRGAEDQAHQLEQMAIAQGERLAQISRHAAEERTALDDEFNKTLEAAGLHNKTWLEQQKLFEDAALKQARAFWRAQLDLIPKQFGPTAANEKQKFLPDNAIIDPFAAIESKASGGPIWQTKSYINHAGEYMLNRADVARPGGYAGVQQMAMAGGRGGATLNLHPGAITIHQLPGQNSQDLAMQVRGVILDVFQNELQ